MFMVTAKLDRRKVIGGALALAVLIAAAVLIFNGGGESETAAKINATVKSNTQRVKYLESLGWQVETEPVEEQTVTIPRDFSEVYEDYNALQKSQGFDLKKYAGLEAVRYTYEVKNHPTATGRVVADMIVYRNKVIAADIQSLSAENGSMDGIKFPASPGPETTPT